MVGYLEGGMYQNTGNKLHNSQVPDDCILEFWHNCAGNGRDHSVHQQLFRSNKSKNQVICYFG
jgi:hypothetical protein